MTSRLAVAMSLYAILGLLAGFTLDGELRIGTLLILGLFAVKTWLGEIKRNLE